jgi:uncharacterized protein YlxW (UPF0749 family)
VRVARRSPRISNETLTLAAVVGLLGFLLVTAVLSARAAEEEQQPRKAELVGLIEQRRELVGDLDIEVERLRAEVTKAQAAAAQRSSADAAASDELAALSEIAGTIAVRGRGLVVRLDNSNRQPASPDQAGAYLIHDADLQLIINGLFAAGAEALDVNGSRVVATTPVRAAGDTIVVNFRPLSPPYVVEAIGADRERFDDTEIARRFKRWSTLFGLGYSVREQDDIMVEAYTGRVGIRVARPGAV